MGWLLSFLVAILTAIAGMFASGFVATLAVGWYGVSSFEGYAGFFVIGLALPGFMGGAVIGLVGARIVAARPRPSFVKALGASVGAVLVIVGGIGGAARLLADIPPEIDGDRLFLLTEIRWPQSGGPAPASMAGPGVVRLGATSGSVVRVTEDGPLFLDQARQVEGRWVIPGAVRVFTSRGNRILDFRIGEKTLTGFIVPLPRHPGAESRTWSEWLPHARVGSPPLPDQFTYRYRIIRQSEPMRTDAIGPFEIETTVAAFRRTLIPEAIGALSTFRVRHRPTGIVIAPAAVSVAVVGADNAVLLVMTEQPDRSQTCQFVSEEDGRARVSPAGSCSALIQADFLTADQARFDASRTRLGVPGWINRATFATPGLYRIGRTIIDTRTLTAVGFEPPSTPTPVRSVPPLDLSPDERSFVWFALEQTEETQPRLAVTRLDTGATYALPIDRARMRYVDFEAVTPAWVRHHFAWERRADGDVLVERSGFTPLPYQGRLTLGKAGEYQGYLLRPGTEALRSALVSLMTTDLGGARLPDRFDGYEQRVQMGGAVLEVTVSPNSPLADLNISTYTGDPESMKRLAVRLDAALATGKYDPLFGESRGER